MIRRLLNSGNWNIGFIDNFTPTDLITNRCLPSIKWMHHSYSDRVFADPHILSCSDTEILLLCEEWLFGHKGRISRLTVSRRNFELLENKVVLELPTHLSYPVIIEKDGTIFIYPENSEAGCIRYYQYNPNDDSLIEKGIIVEGGLTDFTICEKRVKDKYFAISTKLHPDSEENAFLFASDEILGPYSEVGDEPIVVDRSCSRPGGGFFSVGDSLYRLAQDCVGHYGRGLKIMRIESFIPYREHEEFEILPGCYKYNLGLHTLNFQDKLTVVDGYGYLYPTIGRILCSINNIRREIMQHLR